MKVQTQVLSTVEDMRRVRRGVQGSVGVVPTMGALHEGHLALVRRARAENDYVVVTIFVNPTQFGPQEDFDRYPRNLERDLALLQEENVDWVFAPSVEVMYPQRFQTYVDVENITLPLEGASRPGHFRGVATVVLKLFNICQADRAYFGSKDGQQLLVVRQMVRDLNVPVEIVAVDTVREDDGLAVSSRNVYLTPEQRQAAVSISKGLREAATAFSQGEKSADVLRDLVRRQIEAQPLMRIDYVSLADPEDDLAELERAKEGAMLSVAAWVGSTRLIDNIILD